VDPKASLDMTAKGTVPYYGWELALCSNVIGLHLTLDNGMKEPNSDGGTSLDCGRLDAVSCSLCAAQVFQRFGVT
jgi:hypothetical protein